MKKNIINLVLILLSGFLLTGCPDTASHSKGVYMLMDTSGTYKNELEKAGSIIYYLLGTLEPGDSLGVARIDTGSFSEKDIIKKVTFDGRPSVSNQQKRVFREEVDAFISSVKGSKYTDITGGLLQAVEDFGVRTASGEFQAMMDVSLVNKGPVTLLLDSKKHF